MSKEQNIEKHEEQEGIRVYELGFHFVPTISEDEVAVQFSKLKSLIEKKGGQFVSEDAPKLIDLAYEISKTVKTEKKRHTSAYFGWVKFDIDPFEIAGLEKEVKAFDPILRYILITTVRENTVTGSIVKDAAKRVPKDGVAQTEAGETPAKADVVVEVEGDKAVAA